MNRPKRNDAVINVTKQDLMEMLVERQFTFDVGAN